MWKIPEEMRNCYTLFLFFLFLLITNNLHSQNSANRDTQETIQRATLIVSENKLTVINAPYNATLKIYSLVGVKVTERKITLPRQEILLDLPVGYYIVKVGEQTYRITIRQ